MSVTRFVSRGLSFQTRLTLVAAAAVAAAVIGPGLIIYYLMQSALLNQVDQSLRDRADALQIESVQRATPTTIAVKAKNPPALFGDAEGYPQFVTHDGVRALMTEDQRYLPIARRDLQVAAGTSPEYFHSEYAGGTHIRIFTTRVGDGVALQIALPLTGVDAFLEYLRLVLIYVGASGIVIAGVLGRLVAQAALAPIQRLRGAVEHVTETQDMSQRVPDRGQDELSRLAAHFNRMLAGLDQSLRSQRQLVADASHELRTPLASLRTNVEVLKRSPDMPPEERAHLLDDVLAQTQQLTRLIHDLIDLARGDQAPSAMEEVRLDWVVASAVERAVLNYPAVRFHVDLNECDVFGDALRIERAVINLLDNAGKWSRPGDAVEVTVREGVVTVRDHGPGIEPKDLPYVFDRFWRAPGARAMPGSGLGLAIVRQVAEAHGASITAELPRGGGTLMRLEFPDSKVPLRLRSASSKPVHV